MCLAAVFAFGAMAVASASASELEFKPESGAFPVLFHSLDGEGKLETAGGTEIKCTELHTHGDIQSAHLGKVHLLFLGCKENLFGTSCHTGTLGSGEVLVQAEFHLGLAHKGTITNIPAVLVLPGTVTLICNFGLAKIVVTGEVIGEITSKLNEQGEHLTLKFEHEAGKVGTQNLLEFLLSLGGSLMTADLKSSVNGGAAELASQESSSLLLTEAGVKVEVHLVP
jgi:hypothetical protein